MIDPARHVIPFSTLGSRAVDFCGHRSGKLTAIAPVARLSGKNRMWACRCDCGRLTCVSTCNLRSGQTSSCGCTRGQASIVQLAGRHFGRLEVLRRAAGRMNGHAVWLCRCRCGKVVSARSDALLRGEWRSCGCLSRDHAAALGRSQRGAANPNWAGGVTPQNVRARSTPEYRAWRLAVFSRDGFACQSCGAYGVVIHAHHVKTFSRHPESRTDSSNGVTLCVGCHWALHHGSPAPVDGKPMIAKRFREGVYGE